MTPAHHLIVDAVRAGVLLIADGNRLKFKAISHLSPVLAVRLKAHKADVLAVLRAGGVEVDPRPTVGDSAPQTVYSIAERGLLAEAGIDLSDVPMPMNIKEVFPNAEVIDARRLPQGTPRTPRQQVADLLRQTRRQGATDLAATLRDSWRERMAICTIDGGLSPQEAEAVAIEEIRNLSQ